MDVDADVSPWRRNHLRDSTRHDKRAGAIAVVHQEALSAAAREHGRFQGTEMARDEGRPSRRYDRSTSG
jgi:hypothetical protein